MIMMMRIIKMMRMKVTSWFEECFSIQLDFLEDYSEEDEEDYKEGEL